MGKFASMVGASAVILMAIAGCSVVVEAPATPSVAESPAATAADDASQINGLYQVTITEDELAAGA